MTTTVRLTWWVNGHRIERDLLKARCCPKCSTTARVELQDGGWPDSCPFMPVKCGLCETEYALDQRPRSIRDAESDEQRRRAWEAVDAQCELAQKLVAATDQRAHRTDDVAGVAMAVPPGLEREQAEWELRRAMPGAVVTGVDREQALQRALRNEQNIAHLERQWRAGKRSVLERLRDALWSAWYGAVEGWRG